MAGREWVHCGSTFQGGAAGKVGCAQGGAAHHGPRQGLQPGTLRHQQAVQGRAGQAQLLQGAAPADVEAVQALACQLQPPQGAAPWTHSRASCVAAGPADAG